MGPSIDSNRALVFGVCELYLIKMAFSTTNDVFLYALQLAILIDLVSVLYVWYIVFLPMMAVNNSVMNAKISAMT